MSDSEGTVFDIHYGDVLIKYGSVLDAEKADVPKIANDAVANRQTCDCLQDGDVIIADTAEDSAVGKCTELCNSAGKKVFSGLHTMPLRPMRKYASGYLGHYLNSPAFHDQLLPLMQGIKVISVSRSAMLVRLRALSLLSAEQYEKMKVIPVLRSALEYGYSDLALYRPGNENLFIGDYGDKARRLFDGEKISEGHYRELLSKIGINLGIGDEE